MLFLQAQEMQACKGDKETKENALESVEALEQCNHYVQVAHVKRCHACRSSIKR